MGVTDDIIKFVKDGQYPDTLVVREKGDLVLLNYRQEVQFNNLWTPINSACRGLIINRKTGEVIARPFDKFFNWGENNRTTDANIKVITEKMDGSLGILYRDCGFKITTRGSFESDHGLWATEFFNKNYHSVKPFIHDEWTVLFEIIYPNNRVVVDYKGTEDLVLLSIRNRFTGEYLPFSRVQEFAKEHKFSTPKVYQYESIDKIKELSSKISANTEGWVVEFEDGQRFKFKGDEYKKIHKLISGLSFKFILENHEAGTLQHALSIIPDEFKEEVNGWITRIEETMSSIKQSIEVAFEKAPKTSRKEYAIWCNDNAPDLLPYMFARLDGNDLNQIIYKRAFV